MEVVPDGLGGECARARRSVAELASTLDGGRREACELVFSAGRRGDVELTHRSLASLHEFEVLQRTLARLMEQLDQCPEARMWELTEFAREAVLERAAFAP